MSYTKAEQWCLETLKKEESRLSDNQLLSKLTVVIPSFNRPDFLARQVAYWANELAQVVILDGSTRSLGLQFKQELKRYPNINYVHAPVIMPERLAMARNYIQTDYAIFLGDDEFLLKSGLCKAIAKLDADPNFVGCIGQSLCFFVDNEQKVISYGSAYPHLDYQVDQSSPQARLKFALSNYNAPTCYAVLRRSVWIDSWSAGEKWTSPYAAEMKQVISTLVSGKVTSTPEIYWMRSVENKPVNMIGFNRDLSFYEWWCDQSFAAEHTSFVKLLSRQVQNLHNCAQSDAETIVLSGISVFVSAEQERKDHFFRTASKILKLRLRIARMVKNVLSEWIYLQLKKTMFSLSKIQRIGNLGHLMDLRQKENARHFKITNETNLDIQNLEKLILNFYSAREAQSNQG